MVTTQFKFRLTREVFDAFCRVESSDPDKLWGYWDKAGSSLDGLFLAQCLFNGVSLSHVLPLCELRDLAYDQFAKGMGFFNHGHLPAMCGYEYIRTRYNVREGIIQEMMEDNRKAFREAVAPFVQKQLNPKPNDNQPKDASDDQGKP